MAENRSCFGRYYKFLLRLFLVTSTFISGSWIVNNTAMAQATINNSAKVPNCTARQLWGYRSPAFVGNEFISETLYFKNIGKICTVQQGEVGIQIVSGRTRSPIGLSTANNVVTYPPIAITKGQIVTALFVVRLLPGVSIVNCGRDSVMGIIVRSPIVRLREKYFIMPGAHVCTNNFVSITGSLLARAK